MNRSRNIGAAVIGLLVVAAISVAAGSGRKPAKEQGTTVSLRRVSGDEVVQILRRFPEMIPDYLASKKDDEAYLAEVFQFSEVTATALERLLPAVRLYRGSNMALPPHPYLMAIDGEKRYMMPSGLNRLLLDNGLEVTDRNILDLAKIFVTLAVGDEGYSYPAVAFLAATRIRDVIDGTPYRARIQVRVGEQIEDWYFAVLQSQFSFVARRGPKGLIKNYLPTVVESLPARGQLSPPGPKMAIDTSGYVLVQYDDSSHAHFYLIAEENGSPTVHDTVVFCLDSFPPESTNVYVRVRDEILGADRYLHKVNMSAGAGNDTWKVLPVGPTGIFIATAGYADPAKPESTYQAKTTPRELTLG